MLREIATAEPAPGSQLVSRVTEKIIILSLILYAVFAPHSIAITQASYLIGMAAWLVQILASGSIRQWRSPVDIGLFGFFACCVVSSFFSYELLTSVKGLKSPAFFLAFYFVSCKIKDLKFARLLLFLIIASCLVNVAYSAGQLVVGHGLRIVHINLDSPFAGEGLEAGDVILTVDDQKVERLEDISRIADTSRGRLKITYQRNEATGETSISRRAIRQAEGSGVDKLGITASPGRNFRISGFYSHYETYAEVLQLIAALAIGMFIAQPKKHTLVAVLLVVATTLIVMALLLTSTRAALAGLAFAILMMALASSRRRALLIAVMAVVLLTPIAYYVVKNSRGNILFNLQEDSASYRFEVWREALTMIKDHPLTGIGKGSEGGAYLREKYALYDGGKLPPGHFHSSIIQIATWWGLVALAFYIATMTIFFRETWKVSSRLRSEKRFEIWGIVLGGLGALTAFNVSSLVHFNFGDGEVVMMLWLITGIVFAVRRLTMSELADTNIKLVTPSEADLHKSLSPTPKASSEKNVRVLVAKQNSKPQ